ncbi:MAG: heavy metal translocating P-type ATPase, partial [Eubacteriales bacterium]|nr:heavy metal translocating P-type ATPase [Eubacteriales bacterium]
NLMNNGSTEKVNPQDVKINDQILVKPGEKIPLDGVIINGQSVLDTSALTGESMPKEVSTGQDALNGCINLTGTLTIRVTKEYEDSTVAKILDLVENAESRKAKVENFITRFARYYTPAVVIIAAFMAVLPPVFIQSASFQDWIYRSLTFLVISCPCALVLSIPLSFFGGIGGASKQGILIKGSNYLEALANAEIAVFDKTGTLTKGTFTVTEIHPRSITKEQLLELATYAENYSLHPIALSLQQAYGKTIDENRIQKVEEIPGHGIEAIIDGEIIYIGNNKLMDREGITDYDTTFIGTAVHLAKKGNYLGYIEIADEIKEDAIKAIRDLKDLGIRDTVMLTGDNERVGNRVSETIGLSQVFTQLLPADKVEVMEKLLKETSQKGKLLYVGDGINDAPVLARADVGIAMGGLGSDAAIEAADVVIMTDEPSKVAAAIKVARKTMVIAKQNIAFSLIIKAAVLFLGALGIATMWAAVFADVGVSVLAILNALRTLKN